MINYNVKADRAFNTITGRFVKFSFARLSSIYRKQYEPIMVQKLSLKDFSTEELLEEFKSRGVPKKEWELILPPSTQLSPLMMYTELHGHLSKRQYQKLTHEINALKQSNRKQRVLSEYYDSWVKTVKSPKKKK